MDRQVYFHRAYWFCYNYFVNLGNVKFVNEESNNRNGGNEEKNKMMERKDRNKMHEIETFMEPDANITMVLMTVAGRNEKVLGEFKF